MAYVVNVLKLLLCRKFMCKLRFLRLSPCENNEVTANRSKMREKGNSEQPQDL